jgi:hypothetical protein
MVEHLSITSITSITDRSIPMSQHIITIALLLVLVLGVVSPFSALAALMLIVVGLLLYGLLMAVVRALLTGEDSRISKAHEDR